jgi:RNA polymerase sigma-70 factor (ECF subfamily)
MSSGNPCFSTTHWSVVLGAIQADPEAQVAALERLCQRYWPPVYAFLRQRGHNGHQAEDLTQGFFHFILERQALHRIDPKKGRFRSFLLTSLTNFVHNERDKVQARKRGGRHQIVSLDDSFAESVASFNIADGQPPEALFDRQWALMLVQRVLGELRKEFEERQKLALFDGLQPFLTGEPNASDYERLAGDLGMAPDTVKVTLHRLRRRFGELLRNEVAHTVERPEDVETEIRHLLAAIAD